MWLINGISALDARYNTLTKFSRKIYFNDNSDETMGRINTLIRNCFQLTETNLNQEQIDLIVQELYEYIDQEGVLQDGGTGLDNLLELVRLWKITNNVNTLAGLFV